MAGVHGVILILDFNNSRMYVVILNAKITKKSIIGELIMLSRVVELKQKKKKKNKGEKIIEQVGYTESVK